MNKIMKFAKDVSMNSYNSVMNNQRRIIRESVSIKESASPKSVNQCYSEITTTIFSGCDFFTTERVKKFFDEGETDGEFLKVVKEVSEKYLFHGKSKTIFVYKMILNQEETIKYDVEKSMGENITMGWSILEDEKNGFGDDGYHGCLVFKMEGKTMFEMHMPSKRNVRFSGLKDEHVKGFTPVSRIQLSAADMHELIKMLASAAMRKSTPTYQMYLEDADDACTHTLHILDQVLNMPTMTTNTNNEEEEEEEVEEEGTSFAYYVGSSVHFHEEKIDDHETVKSRKRKIKVLDELLAQRQTFNIVGGVYVLNPARGTTEEIKVLRIERKSEKAALEEARKERIEAARQVRIGNSRAMYFGRFGVAHNYLVDFQ